MSFSLRLAEDLPIRKYAVVELCFDACGVDAYRRHSNSIVISLDIHSAVEFPSFTGLSLVILNEIFSLVIR